jgi:hypothetical protein
MFKAILKFLGLDPDARLRLMEFEARQRAEEREHQHRMLDTLFTKLAEGQRVQNEPLMELAKAQIAQASVMQQWLEGFRVTNPDPVPPQVVRPEEEWMKEQMRLSAILGSDAMMPELPPEFQLAFDLARQQSEDFNREGSDF